MLVVNATSLARFYLADSQVDDDACINYLLAFEATEPVFSELGDIPVIIVDIAAQLSRSASEVLE